TRQPRSRLAGRKRPLRRRGCGLRRRGLARGGGLRRSLARGGASLLATGGGAARTGVRKLGHDLAAAAVGRRWRVAGIACRTPTGGLCSGLPARLVRVQVPSSLVAVGD